MKRSLYKIAHLLMLFFLLAVLPLGNAAAEVIPSRAALEGTGVIQGKVTSEATGEPIPLMRVEVRNVNNASDSFSTDTDRAGVYTITGLPAGQYAVYFTANGQILPDTAYQKLNFLPEYYNEYGFLTVLENSIQNGIDASLLTGGQITGQVVSVVGSIPLPDVFVTLYGSGYQPYSLVTDSFGNFVFIGLETGKYRMEFDPTQCEKVECASKEYLPEYYQDHKTSNWADLISVTAGQNTNVQTWLTRLGTISGQVTSDMDGSPLAGISVSADNAYGIGEGSSSTDLTGRYTISGLPAGGYRIQFNDPNDVYFSETYNNKKTNTDSPDLIQVRPGHDEEHISAGLGDLRSAGSIAGRVTNPANLPVSGIVVEAIDATGSPVSESTTDDEGNYLLTHLAQGQYHVLFHNDGHPDLVPEYFNNKRSLAEGGLVNVIRGETTSAIDVTLDNGGKITGTVSVENTGKLLANIGIILTQNGKRVYTTVTDLTGHYSISAVAEGDYKIQFDTDYCAGSSCNTPYQSEYYNNKASLEEADLLHMTVGAVLTADAALTPGALISGRVYSNQNNAVIEGASIFLYSEGSSDSIGLTTTDHFGRYKFNLPGAGTYYLQAVANSKCDLQQCWPDDFSSQYYSNRDQAIPLVVADREIMSDRNFYLNSGEGKITGTVYGAQDNLKISSVEVIARGKATGVEVEGFTNAEGKYTIIGLPTDEYTVQFVPMDCPNCPHLYRRQYYKNSPTLETAILVAVTSGVTTAGIDAALVSAGIITGKITDAETGAGLENVSIQALDFRGDSVYETISNAQGEYRFVGLTPGSYRIWFPPVRVAPNTLDYLGEYYNDQTSFEASSPVTVADGQVVSGIDADLALSSSISGQITANDTGSGLERVAVVLYSESGYLVYKTYSDVQGFYHFKGLTPGSYRLRFLTNDDHLNPPHYYYKSEYYNKKATLELADSVTVTSGQAVSGINAALDPVGGISGKVTDEGSGAGLDHVLICIVEPSGFCFSSEYSDEEGNYRFDLLDPGSYRLWFRTDLEGMPQATQNHKEEYYDNQDTIGLAEDVVVTDGAITTGIDAALALKPEIPEANFDLSTRSLNENVGNTSVDLKLSTASSETITVPFIVSGSATSGLDHTLAGGQFVFSPGQTTKTIPFRILDDSLHESDESIVITLQSPTNATLGQKIVQTITIVDNDPWVDPHPAPTLTRALPTQQDFGKASYFILYGTNFDQGSKVFLRTGSQSIALDTEWWDSAIYLPATVPAETPSGLYDIVMVNPDGKQAVLQNGYRILPPRSEDLFAMDYDLWTYPATIFEWDKFIGDGIAMGLNVQRQGGSLTLSNLPVRFYLGNPAAGGTLIGTTVVESLPPRQTVRTISIHFEAPPAGTYQVYAVIDPDNAVVETNESNNTIQQTIIIYPKSLRSVDLVSPVVESFKINNGALWTANPQVKFSVRAADKLPGSGVKSIIFYEYSFDDSIQKWVLSQTPRWQAYTAAASYSWTLSKTAGAKYIQAWAADWAGNVSSAPLTQVINYIPATDTLASGQSRYYVYPLTSGQGFKATLTPQTGDADLYVWAPDFESREPWKSIATSGVEQVLFTAPVTGMYVVQVYAYTATTYQFSASQVPAPAALMATTAAADKVPLTAPGLEPGTIPSEKHAIVPVELLGPAKNYIYLPLTVR